MGIEQSLMKKVEVWYEVEKIPRSPLSSGSLLNNLTKKRFWGGVPIINLKKVVEQLLRVRDFYLLVALSYTQLQ